MVESGGSAWSVNRLPARVGAVGWQSAGLTGRAPQPATTRRVAASTAAAAASETQDRRTRQVCHAARPGLVASGPQEELARDPAVEDALVGLRRSFQREHLSDGN